VILRECNAVLTLCVLLLEAVLDGILYPLESPGETVSLDNQKDSMYNVSDLSSAFRVLSRSRTSLTRRFVSLSVRSRAVSAFSQR
jgi:hypothetical protein